MRREFLFVMLALGWLFGTTARPCDADTFAYVPKSDGTIARFRVDARTGNLNLLPGATLTGIARPIALCLSTDGRFLYAYPIFDRQKDGYSYDELQAHDKKHLKSIQTKPTPIMIYGIESGGQLRQKQTFYVPGPVGQLTSCPNTRFVYGLTAGGAFLLQAAASSTAKPLVYMGKVNVQSGMSLLDMSGDRDAWRMTFSPKGNYLYVFDGDGFIDHSENYLRRYRISLATGQTAQEGEIWSDRDADESSDAKETGAVMLFVGRTAFIVGFAPGCALRPTDKAGRIARSGSRSPLRPTDQTPFHDAQTLVRHPALPLVVYRGSFADPYTVWRVVGPGKVVKVGGFASTFVRRYTPPGEVQGNCIEPEGRFFYEFTPQTAREQSPRIAVFALSANRTRAKLSVPAMALPIGCARAIVFATVLTAPQPAKSAK